MHFMRVIPADRHLGAMEKIRRGGLPAGRGNGFRTRPSVGKQKGPELPPVLGGGRWEPTLHPRLLALPEDCSLNSEQGCLL